MLVAGRAVADGLEERVVSQGIGIIAVLVAAGDHEDALHDLLFPRVDDLAPVTVIG